MKYRSKYIEHLRAIGYPLPSDLRAWEVHHIDGERNNNKYSNLVLIPKELHTEYHRAESVLLRYKRRSLNLLYNDLKKVRRCIDTRGANYALTERENGIIANICAAVTFAQLENEIDAYVRAQHF